MAENYVNFVKNKTAEEILANEHAWDSNSRPYLLAAAQVRCSQEINAENRRLQNRILWLTVVLVVAAVIQAGSGALTFVALCVNANPSHQQASSKSPDSQSSELTARKSSIEYEISLRQRELDEMDQAAKNPRAVGVSSEWLRRHAQLKEKLIALSVELNKVNNEIASRQKIQ